MKLRSKIWKEHQLPRRILVVRLQAMGDVVITLPYLQALRNMLPPEVEIDFLTREESSAIPAALSMFRKLYVIGGGRSFKKQIFFAGLLLPRLLLNRYDVVIDLQNNILTKRIRQVLNPKAWSEFDRISGNAAGERNRMTIEAVGLGRIVACNELSFSVATCVDDLLKQNGWDGENELVILNPAGAFATRNWPMKNYISFAQLWLQRFPRTQFVITGVGLIADKAILLKNALGDALINLVQQTTALEAMMVVRHAKLVLSEDSGLMHMAWVNDVPTVALFGSTRSDWSRPLGEHSLLLGSSDLACGNCMREHCLYSDVPCLTRYSAEQVLEAAMEVVKR